MKFLLVLAGLYVLSLLVCLAAYLIAVYRSRNGQLPKATLGDQIVKPDSVQMQNISNKIIDDFRVHAINEVALITPKSAPNRYHGNSDKATKQIADIEEKIKLEVLRRKQLPRNLAFAAVCGTFEIDIESETLHDDFISEIYKRLRLQGQLVKGGANRVPEWGGVRNMLQHVLESAFELLLNADENMEIVIQYMPMLLARRRSLSTRDKYGDEDLRPWIDFSSKFAVDKLKGVSSLKFFMEMQASRQERSMVSGQGLADMFGCFTRISIALHEAISGGKHSELMSGVEYEEMLRAKIEEIYPEAHVTTTAATGDHGSDLIVDIYGRRIAIQAKYYQSSVGNSAVQEAFSGKGFYGADFAMVVCNSSYTRHARDLSERLGVELATTDDFIDKIKSLIKSKSAQE